MATKVYNRVFEVFFKNPTQTFHIRELAKLTKSSHTGAAKVLRKLEKEKLIKKVREAVTIDYTADLDSKKFHTRKQEYNIKSLAKLIDFLSEKYNEPEAIALFGSYATGYDTETSDVDILIITPKQLDLDLRRFEKDIKRKISIHEVKDLTKASKEFRNNLANGIVLYGYLKVI